MNRTILILLIPFAALAYSCTPVGNPRQENVFLSGSGLFIVNEGNFMWGNGSVSFYSFDSLKIYNEIFFNANGRPPGDVPNSMAIHGGRAFIVVNNSDKIEVVDCSSFKTIAVIAGVPSPRQLLIVSPSMGYVTSLYSTKISVIDINEYRILSQIETGKTTEAMVKSGNRVYVSNWAGGNEIIEINTLTNEVVNRVEVGREPESMVLDNSGMLWVLCTGGYSGEFFPELSVVDPVSMSVRKTFRFASKSMYPSSLVINATGDTLYYIERSVWRMPVSSADLPAEPFIRASGRTFYRLARDPANGNLYATNAMDYQQRGYLIVANSRGSVTDSVRAGIIPGSMCFKYK